MTLSREGEVHDRSSPKKKKLESGEGVSNAAGRRGGAEEKVRKVVGRHGVHP